MYISHQILLVVIIENLAGMKLYCFPCELFIFRINLILRNLIATQLNMIATQLIFLFIFLLSYNVFCEPYFFQQLSVFKDILFSYRQAILEVISKIIASPVFLPVFQLLLFLLYFLVLNENFPNDCSHKNCLFSFALTMIGHFNDKSDSKDSQVLLIFSEASGEPHL